jgi:hypothetical protein
MLAFSRLAGQDHPLVICFDQIEALQIHPRDQAGLFAFGQLISDLHDQTHNVLMISCVQSSFLVQLREYVAGQNYNRLARLEGSLDLLDKNQAVRLIELRLKNRPELAALRAAHAGEPLWPLAETPLRAWLSGHPKAAREILTHCARLLSTLPPPSLLDFLANLWKERVEQSAVRSDVHEAESILGEGLPLLFQLTEKNWRLVRADDERDLHQVFEGPEGRIGLVHCTQMNMIKLAAHLRRLRDPNRGPKVRKLVLVRDPRLPISASAKKARAYLKDLKSAGAGYLQPSVEVFAALDALRSVLSDAKSGDLANGGDAVEPALVEDWLMGSLPQDLIDFAKEILASPRTG